MKGDAPQADRGTSADLSRFKLGDSFDPAELTEAEAAHILAAVDAMSGLSDSAKETYRALFMLARRRAREVADDSM
jgi:hypothetical protein